jgi:hypothetical protein
MRNKLLTGMALTLLIGNAYADTGTCPHPATVKQSALDGGGFSYSAPGPNGRMWQGENEYAAQDYLDTIQFNNAAFKADTAAVICSYEGQGEAAVRLTLKPVKDWKAAAGTSWSGQQCTASDISRCSFEYAP